MGKTLPPFSQLIECERRRWAPFKRVLPKEDQVIFDRLFDCAKLHIQAGVMASHPWPFETMVMSILLEHQKQVQQLERLLDELHSRGQALSMGSPALQTIIYRIKAVLLEIRGTGLLHKSC